jgi:CheY-like chemotaxis protein
MKPDNNVLVVDDEYRWRDFYEDEVRQLGVRRVCTVKNLADATRAIDSMRFAVAIVDVGLEEANDRNIDGLQVMKRIRKAGDQTSIILVTGRSGPDVLPIVRDALKKYDALDTIAKASRAVDQLGALVESGIRAYESATSNERDALYNSLHGDADGFVWDYEMMRGTNIDGGAAGLYATAEGLFGPFVPLISETPKGVQVRQGVACGAFWSRGTGQPVLGCFGANERIQALIRRAGEEGRALDSYAVGEVLREYKRGGTSGVVYLLGDHTRGDFASVFG